MIKVIFFDFDGVILDSMPIRDYGFRKILEEYPLDIVEDFIKFHQENAGLSRFYKIKYFYSKYLNKDIREEKIQEYATKFSEIMRSELPNEKYLISETVSFIRNNYKKMTFHIVSGSEQNELRFLCEQLGLSKYFKSIEGSPTHKNDLVKNILNKEKYILDESILIGDSINDFNAASINGIKFYGFNNPKLRLKDEYLNTISELEEIVN
ncbi:haloacid dehalogenase [Arcobacter sp. CECT 8983]|uniref:HAD family hydrolase n=1 Tax=Arcobacter sp. CECT 8983 TaxID=2044508 RepID=UPI00100B6CB9|nr:HAD hydrolase-like protein [Arcobacter sp. CECT 8983]RXJ90578.1 haloacid dehalogenase [Arcobacter sp. CECT 8983]